MKKKLTTQEKMEKLAEMLYPYWKDIENPDEHINKLRNKENETQFKGTWGEWHLDNNGVIYSKEPSIKTICVVNSGISTLTEDNANALLISKSPEMLEMLQKLKDFGASHGMTYDLYEDLSNLIQEATDITK